MMSMTHWDFREAVMSSRAACILEAGGWEPFAAVWIPAESLQWEGGGRFTDAHIKIVYRRRKEDEKESA